MITRRQASGGILASAALAAAPTVVVAQEPKPFDLPPPRSEGGQPLTTALKLRRSTREYSNRPLPVQVLSDLLWAAFGVNRPSGDRTAPYWRHIMVMEIYVAMADGVWLYEPKAHTLLPHLKDDIRAQTGLQDFVATAPLNLVYVAHGERMTEVSAEERRLYASVDTGFIGQNVYLFCASEGLATVFRERSTIQSSLAPCSCQTSSSDLRADSGIPPRLKICGGATTGKRVRRTPIRCSMKRISQSWLIVSRACWSQIPPGPLPRYSSSTLASIATTQGRLVPIVRRTTYRSLP